MSSIHTQEIEVEVEADYARISLLTDKASFKSLSPQLQWAITTAQSYGTLLGMCVTVPMTIECYAGEEPVYYPNDKAYPGSPPYAEVEVSDKDFMAYMREALIQMRTDYWPFYSWYDHYYMWRILEQQLWTYVDYIHDKYEDFVEWPEEPEPYMPWE